MDLLVYLGKPCRTLHPQAVRLFSSSSALCFSIMDKSESDLVIGIKNSFDNYPDIASFLSDACRSYGGISFTFKVFCNQLKFLCSIFR